MLKTGFTPDEIGKIGGGNFLRIFDSVTSQASYQSRIAELSASMVPPLGFGRNGATMEPRMACSDELD
jgi:hypothetical protein